MNTKSNLLLDQQLQELQFIQCSLLPSEHFTFLLPPEDVAIWASLLEDRSSKRTSDSDSIVNNDPPFLPSQARFQVRLSGARIWFEAELPSLKSTPSTPPSPRSPRAAVRISVKGENISRDVQERWQALVRAGMQEVETSEYPVYELLSLHLLPKLHEELSSCSDPQNAEPEATDTPRHYHALLTSHHLVSPTKRRSMQQWSSELGITGFAKVGYPGIIYAEGPQHGVEEFVANVKAMQWLALRVRFLEPVERLRSPGNPGDRWIELQKIGEMLEEMRKQGREALITDLGIGCSSKQ
ncbi:hypothetical protein BU15DRAFT_49279 [Melanogaster broomeanus]|nr:hypothetical protein BU15DRAFT_49279 [Melanogaster broomeanus]